MARRLHSARHTAPPPPSGHALPNNMNPPGKESGISASAGTAPGLPAAAFARFRTSLPALLTGPTMHTAPTSPAAFPMLRRALFALLLLLSFAGLGGCVGLPPGHDYPKTVSTALEHPETTRLGKEFGAAAAAHAGQSAFRLLPVGIEGFLLRAQMIDATERTLDVQYYILRGDETGKLLAEAVLRAAERGVRVRILVDDLANADADTHIEVLSAHPNIEVRMYNPLRYRGNLKAARWAETLLFLGRLDYRMHNKLMIVDNSIALVGGRNIGDQYFQIDPEGQLGDYETFAGGPIVRGLSNSFDDFWASELAIPVAALAKAAPTAADLAKYRAELREHRQEKREDGSDYATRVATGEPLRGMLALAYQPVAAPATPAAAAAATADTGPITRRASMLVWAPAQVKYDPPNKREVEKEQAPGPKIRDVVDEAAERLRSEFLMISAYLIPGADGMRLFDKLGERNIPARVITNSMESNSEPSAHSGYLHYRTDILRDKVELYEVRAHLGSARGSGQTAAMNRNGTFGIHTKVYVFDRERLFVSSMNFDARSRHINTELGLMIDSPDLARQAAALFDGLAQPANSYRVTLEPRGHLETPQVVWRTLESGRIVEFYKDPAKDEWQRLQVEMMSLLPFDYEL